MGPLYDELETNHTRRNAIAAQMHDLQHEFDMLKIDAGRIAERIEEKKHYYHQGELDLVQWPADCNMNPTPTPMTRAESADPKPETQTDWNSTTPAVPCFIERHPRGTLAHLITECDIFMRYTVSDCARSIIHLNLCWGCWMPRLLRRRPSTKRGRVPASASLSSMSVSPPPRGPLRSSLGHLQRLGEGSSSRATHPTPVN